ncbi:hypothetical protein WH357_13960 [Enterobacter ludwigii]
MEKFKVMDKLYYPLSQVAEVLECNVMDLYHFASVGSLSISVYIKHHKYYIENSECALSGYYTVQYGNFSDLQFDDSIDAVITSVISIADNEIIDFGKHPLILKKKFLSIMLDDLTDFKLRSIEHFKKYAFDEHVRTANRKGEIIPALLAMIPDFDGMDLSTESASKISSILEAIAAKKGIELSLPDKNTWARYLGRK